MYLNLVGKFCSLILHAFRASHMHTNFDITFTRSKRLLSKSRFSRSNKSQLVALKLPARTTSMVSFTTLFLFYSLLSPYPPPSSFSTQTPCFFLCRYQWFLFSKTFTGTIHRWLLSCIQSKRVIADTLHILRELSIRCRRPKPLVGPGFGPS